MKAPQKIEKVKHDFLKGKKNFLQTFVIAN